MELSELWATQGRLPDFEKIKLVLSEHPEWVNEKHPKKSASLFEAVFSLVAPDDRDYDLVKQILDNSDFKPNDRFIRTIICSMKSDLLAMVIGNPALSSLVHHVDSGELSYKFIEKKLEMLANDLKELIEEDPTDSAIQEIEIDIKNYNEMLAMLKSAVVRQDNVSIFSELRAAGVLIDTTYLNPIKNPAICAFLKKDLASDPASPPSSTRLRPSEESSSASSSPESSDRSDFIQDLINWRDAEKRAEELQRAKLQSRIGIYGQANRELRQEIDEMSKGLKKP